MAVYKFTYLHRAAANAQCKYKPSVTALFYRYKPSWEGQQFRQSTVRTCMYTSQLLQATVFSFYIYTEAAYLID